MIDLEGQGQREGRTWRALRAAKPANKLVKTAASNDDDGDMSHGDFHEPKRNDKLMMPTTCRLPAG